MAPFKLRLSLGGNELIQKKVAKGHSDRGFMNDAGKAVLGEATQLDVSVAGKALFFSARSGCRGFMGAAQA